MCCVCNKTTLYGCETWTLTRALGKRIETLEVFRSTALQCIPYTAHRTNESVEDQIGQEVGKCEALFEIVRKRKMQWFEHVARRPDNLTTISLQGTLGRWSRGRFSQSLMLAVLLVLILQELQKTGKNWGKLLLHHRCPSGQCSLGTDLMHV